MLEQHMNRNLDINEILAREYNPNNSIDAYEYFLRIYTKNNSFDSLDEYEKTFFLCEMFSGEIGCGGISQFYNSNSCILVNEVLDALNKIGDKEMEHLLNLANGMF